MLEECGLEYKVKPVNITKDEQYEESFLKLSPNNKIPAIYDSDNNISLMESGAILIYLSEKTGLFKTKSKEETIKRDEWLMFQMASIGPMLGQVHHFLKFNKGKAPYAEDRYSKEALRLYAVLDRRLSISEYIGGKEYGITDIATWPWISRYEWQEIKMNDFPNVFNWYKKVAAREAVIKGYDVPSIGAEIPIP